MIRELDMTFHLKSNDFPAGMCRDQPRGLLEQHPLVWAFDQEAREINNN